MAIDTTYFATDLAGMIADLPVTGKLGYSPATEFTCSATELTTEETLVLTGNVTGRAITITFPITSFTVTAAFKPQARMPVKFPDTTAYTNYEIVSISKSQDAIAYIVVLSNDIRSP